MVLNKRERLMAIVVGIVVGLAIVYYVAIGPFLDYRAQITTDLAKAAKTQHQYALTDQRYKQAEAKWKALTTGEKRPIVDDQNVAAIQGGEALTDWAQEVNLYVTAARQDTMSSVDDKASFIPITFHVVATGSFKSVCDWMYKLERPTLPMKVTDISITPHGRKGTDDLSVTATVATVYLNPAQARSVPARSGGVK